jgi:hypothetical protein
MRRSGVKALADAAGSSLLIHNDGTGAAFGTGRWYRTVVEAVSRNIDDLIEREGWSWRRSLGELVFVIVDALVLGGFVAALAAAAV